MEEGRYIKIHIIFKYGGGYTRYVNEIEYSKERNELRLIDENGNCKIISLSHHEIESYGIYDDTNE